MKFNGKKCGSWPRARTPRVNRSARVSYAPCVTRPISPKNIVVVFAEKLFFHIFFSKTRFLSFQWFFTFCFWFKKPLIWGTLRWCGPHGTTCFSYITFYQKKKKERDGPIKKWGQEKLNGGNISYSCVSSNRSQMEYQKSYILKEIMIIIYSIQIVVREKQKKSTNLNSFFFSCKEPPSKVMKNFLN